MDIINKESFEDAIRIGNLPMNGIASILMKIMKIDQINELYDKYQDEKGLAFVDAVLNYLNIKIDINEQDIKNIPLESAFIAIANHPFGGIEGLIMLKILGEIRPEIKLMANFILKKIPAIQDQIIAVNPFEDYKNTSSVSGIKNTVKYLQNGNPIGIFPAGEVSSYQSQKRKITDKDWNPVIGKIITKTKVPVLPIYFDGNNGLLFNLLGLINQKLRTAQLPNELLNKKGHVIKVRIGKCIKYTDLESFDSNSKMLLYLRARTYALASGIEVKNILHKNIFKIKKKPEAIIAPVNAKLIQSDISKLSANNLILTEKNYQVYITNFQEIPNIIKEIGRLREITFREVGEGTNKSIDLDKYDIYYKHLFIWDQDALKIVGSYRVGLGDQIMEHHGIGGFYIRNLFKIKKGFSPIMSSGLELGRSFITKDYQQKALPLFLLWKGILKFVIQNPKYRYLFGPVSISNNYSKLSKRIIVSYLKKECSDDTFANLIKAKKQFKFDTQNETTQILIEKKNSIKSLDTIISDIEQNHAKVPVLIRQYIQMNAKILGFNIDPKFNNCLDGFLLLDILLMPKEMKDQLSK
jgi:putative hemolysin